MNMSTSLTHDHQIVMISSAFVSIDNVIKFLTPQDCPTNIVRSNISCIKSDQKVRKKNFSPCC